MNLKHLCVFACALLATLFSACEDKPEEPELRAGGVHILSYNSKDWINGHTYTMSPSQTSLTLTLGSRGIPDDGFIIVRSSSPLLKAELLDPFDPETLPVYDSIQCSDGNKVWYDKLYEQRVRITDIPLTNIPPEVAETETREIEIKVIPVGGYKVYSNFTIVHLMPVEDDNTEENTSKE